MIVVNYKTYQESILASATELTKKLQSLDIKFKEQLLIAPSIFDIVQLTNLFEDLKFCAQGVSNAAIGSSTGRFPIEVLNKINVEYTLLNHSENRIESHTQLSDTIENLHKNSIKIILCCETIEEATEFTKYSPFAIAYEPKNLIGSGVSVTTQQNSIREFVDVVKNFSLPYIGAGISNSTDIELGKKLGAKGFLLASAFVKSETPVEFISSLLSEFCKS